MTPRQKNCMVNLQGRISKPRCPAPPRIIAHNNDPIQDRTPDTYSIHHMDHPQTIPLISLFLAEFAFGLLYAALIHWISVNNYLAGSTAWSVVIGDAATLFIEWLFFHDNWSPWITFWCFASSGLP